MVGKRHKKVISRLKSRWKEGGEGHLFNLEMVMGPEKGTLFVI